MHSIAEAVTRLADVLSKAIIQHGKHVEAAGIHISEAIDRLANPRHDEADYLDIGRRADD